MTTRVLPLAEAVARFVRPGMHLHFASTPQRSNAAVREIARRFRGQRPEFVVSATGFHSTLHLFGRMRLARTLVGCFFGDNYPVPRANALYQELQDSGVRLEPWPLWTYVAALAAGAFGWPYAMTRSLEGTTLGERLADAGKYVTIADPRDAARSIGLVTPIVPDVAFYHAGAGDERGNALFAPPLGEGFHAAAAARQGVIVTVDRLLSTSRVASFPELLPLPRERVLAIAEAPFGAHPQPLHFAPAAASIAGYRDDFEAYEDWRLLATDDAAFARFEREVLCASDGQAAYERFVGAGRLEALRTAATAPRREPVTAIAPSELTPGERLVILAARTIARRARAGRLSTVLAGIGQAFSACRLAQQASLRSGDDVELMVETGLGDLDADAAHPFLLAHRNVVTARRLTSIESVLGTRVAGPNNACLGVIGSAEVDAEGDVNSSAVGGKLLVGPGGAPDIAAGAREVIVLARTATERLVRRVEYVTSRGTQVRAIVTEDVVLERESARAPWSVREVWPSPDALAAFERCCPFTYELEPSRLSAVPANEVERSFIAELRRERGSHPRELRT